MPTNKEPVELGLGMGDIDTEFVMILSRDNEDNLIASYPSDVSLAHAIEWFKKLELSPQTLFKAFNELQLLIYESGAATTGIIDIEQRRTIRHISCNFFEQFGTETLAIARIILQYYYLAMYAEEHRYLGKTGATRSTVGRLFKVYLAFSVLTGHETPDKVIKTCKIPRIWQELEQYLADNKVFVPKPLQAYRCRTYRTASETMVWAEYAEHLGRGRNYFRECTPLKHATCTSVTGKERATCLKVVERWHSEHNVR